MADVLKLVHLLRDRRCRWSTRGRYLRDRGLLQGRSSRADAVRAARHDGDDLGQQLPDGLPRPGAAVAVLVRAGRAATATAALATEAAMKYFVLGALASGLLLYGMSMIYGATGTLDIAEVVQRRSQRARSTHERCWCSAWCSWSPASRSSSARRRSTCGCRTSTTARRRRHAAHRLGAEARRVRHGATACWRTACRPAGRSTGSRCWCVLAVLSLVLGNVIAHRADQPQAHAGLFDDRAHGLHAARAARRGRRQRAAATPAAMFYAISLRADVGLGASA